MDDKLYWFRKSVQAISLCSLLLSFPNAWCQNYERYRPLDPSRIPNADTNGPNLQGRPLPDVSQDDRVLVNTLDAVVILDRADKVQLGPHLDELHGLHFQFGRSESVIFCTEIEQLVNGAIGRPLSLRSVNQLARDIAACYREAGQPIVDVQIPEQRITGGTLQIVVVESTIGQVFIQPGSVFNCAELDRWISRTGSGNLVLESDLESDLFWLNQNPFRRVTVDFEKGEIDGTTNVNFESHDVMPVRGYIGMDDTGVKSLNYGRFFAGLMYGNMFNRGGLLSYQYTTDHNFEKLHAHSVSYNQPLNRNYSVGTYGSWAGVSPMLSGGLSQDGESWQAGASATRHLIKSPTHSRNIVAGIDIKSTNNNLEFAGSTVSTSNADLVQLHLGIDDLVRTNADEYMLLKGDVYFGPGGGLTGAHNAAAFQTIRPGSSPDYAYARFLGEDTSLIGCRWMLKSRLTAQVASERLLFSETLGLGGFDTVRGFDQRTFNGDNGWLVNLEFGPRTERWGDPDDVHSRRLYSFVDLGNGYIKHARAGEDAYTFAASVGVGFRFNVSDRITARFDYGIGLNDIAGSERSNRLHLGFTWIPGERP